MKCHIYHARKKAKQSRLTAQGTALTEAKPKAESQTQGMQDDRQARADYIQSLFGSGSPEKAS